ncbi:MAG TPA: RNA methyltransferase, partial [Anaerovoracaceae bacterium]|nr:RNA methyltransferase [Anaerovoracaceae bacterium]
LNLCMEALDLTDDVKVFFIRESQLNDTSDEAKKIVERIIDSKAKCLLVSDKIFDKITDTRTPQGIAALMKIKRWARDDFFKNANTDNGNILIFDRIQDPGNAGTLLRTAEAANFRGVVAIKGTVDLYNSKVVRSAAGSLLRIPVLFTNDVSETIEIVRNAGKKIVVATPYSDNIYFTLPLCQDVAIVIGNEGQGTHEMFLEKADYTVKIPMSNTVESLNAAMAGGILMYEAVRQNFHKKTEEKR